MKYRLKVQPEAEADLAEARHCETRCSLVARFPYVVYFRMHGDLISVIAVLHGHRNESVWQSRVKNGD